MSDSDVNERAFAFEDDGEEFDLNIPPTSGQEYLRRVHREAQQCQSVVVVEVERPPAPTVTLPKSSAKMAAPSGFAPPLTWQRQKVAQFSKVRQKLSQYRTKYKAEKRLTPGLPGPADMEGWSRLCFGRTQPQTGGAGESDSGSSMGGGERAGQSPLLSTVCSMPQSAVVAVLEYHVNWLEGAGFTPHQGAWLYALLAALEKPLDPDTCAALRQLVRACATLRAAQEGAASPLVPPLNLLICLVGRYFDQADLADS